jgi:thiosulfate dehydrogenase [quinone] large subunit
MASWGHKEGKKVKLSTGSIIIIVAATLLGLFLGNGLGGSFSTDPGNGLLWAVIVGVISAVGAYFAVINYRPARTGSAQSPTELEDPKFAKFLFQDTRSAALWLPIRLFMGIDFLSAGLHKFQDPKWLNDGTALLGYWNNAVAVNAQTGKGAITYDWWRNFLQGMIDSNAHVWFAKLIVFGEILVGLGLIVGGLVGIAAFFGAVMNMSFLLSGSVSVNPIFLTFGIFLILGWKVAGWIGLDRVLLPALGTPWKAGAIFKRDESPQMVS